jgi:RND family efflux transporter MFP subunit
MRLKYLTLIGAAGALFACQGEHPAPVAAEPLPPRKVRVKKLEVEPLRRGEAVAGTVHARVEATLAAKLPGRVKRMPVEVGDRVKKGQTVAVLEAREVEARLRRARAVLAQAKSDLDRYTSLFEKDAATRQELEGYRTKYEVAQAAVREAKSMLEEARIVAPFDGTITRELADVGDLATPGRPLLTIEAPGALQLEAAVSETLVGFLELGQTVPVQLGEDIELEGTIGEIAPSADPSSRTFLVKIDLPDAEGVRPGQFGRALFPAREAEILRAPVEAVVRRGQLQIVFVVEDGEADLRLVRTGRRFGDVVEIASGLESGETVVVEGAETLADGQPVEVEG